MRVLLLSKAFVLGAYHSKLEALAACPGLDLIAAVPPAWRDERGLIRLERVEPRGYRLVIEPLRFNGSFHLHYYPRLSRLLAETRPDLLHIDEEPYNFATWHAQRAARRLGIPTLFFTWQNLFRRYPFPFSYFERQVMRHARAGIAGNQEAVTIWRAKGFQGPLPVIPQFGVDPDVFKPHAHLSSPSDREAAGNERLPSPSGRPRSPQRSGVGGGRGDHSPRSAAVRGEELPVPFTLGYAGRLVPEKGIDLLLRAAAALPSHVRVRLIGAGPERGNLLRLAAGLGLAGRVTVTAAASLQMPAQLAALDCLVLPSRTRPNWKEQFGRVLIEAMACAVPVVASTCGELPHVVGDAGLIFPEGDVPALAAHLQRLHADPALRADLSARGRARVLAHYTQQQVAEATANFYTELLNTKA
jgi:glycosyltransferase involved in cell wall biosynthesis